MNGGRERFSQHQPDEASWVGQGFAVRARRDRVPERAVVRHADLRAERGLAVPASVERHPPASVVIVAVALAIDEEPRPDGCPVPSRIVNAETGALDWDNVIFSWVTKCHHRGVHERARDAARYVRQPARRREASGAHATFESVKTAPPY